MPTTTLADRKGHNVPGTEYIHAAQTTDIINLIQYQLLLLMCVPVRQYIEQ